MRCLVGFVCVLGLVASPVSVGAQAEEEPALQLQLDDAGVEVTPYFPGTATYSPGTVDGYTLEEMDRRVQRARAGLCSESARARKRPIERCNGISHNLESSSDPRSARLRCSRSNATRSFSLKQRSYRGCV
jgi:hypothetical protein